LTAKNAQTLIEALVASHGDQLRRFLLARVRNVADVPDISQEVYLRMLRVPNVEAVRSPEAYLFTVAQHVLQQHGLKIAALPSAELEKVLNTQASAAHLDPCSRSTLRSVSINCKRHWRGSRPRRVPSSCYRDATVCRSMR
jgi:Sigma-70 region 2